MANPGVVIPVSKFGDFISAKKIATFSDMHGDLTKIVLTIEIDVPATANAKVFDAAFVPATEFPTDPLGINHYYVEFTDVSKKEVNSIELKPIEVEVPMPPATPVNLKFPLKILNGKTRWGQ